MNETSKGLEKLIKGLEKCKQYFLSNIKGLSSAVEIYTHIDADGIDRKSVV